MQNEKIKNLLKEALELIKADNYIEACYVLAQAFELNPNDELVIQGLTLLDDKIVEGNFDFQPETPMQYVQRGIARGKKGFAAAAIEDFDNAIELDNAFDTAYCWKGYALHESRMFDKAIENYQYAISIAPKKGFYHDKLANTYLALGDIESALKSHHEAVNAEPEEPLYYYNYAVAAMHPRLEAWDQALVLLDKAIELWPQYEDAKVNREFVLSKMN